MKLVTCYNRSCIRFDGKQDDHTNCGSFLLEELQRNFCKDYIEKSPETMPEERLPLDPKELSTEYLAKAILDRNLSLWYRKEALEEYDTREGLLSE